MTMPMAIPITIPITITMPITIPMTILTATTIPITIYSQYCEYIVNEIVDSAHTRTGGRRLTTSVAAISHTVKIMNPSNNDYWAAEWYLTHFPY